jgi:hypothetical protein
MRELESRNPQIFKHERIVLTPTTNREDVMSYVNLRETYTEWILPAMRKIRSGVLWIRLRVTSGQEYERVPTVDSDDLDLEHGRIDGAVLGGNDNDTPSSSQREDARLKRLKYLEKKNGGGNAVSSSSSSS